MLNRKHFQRGKPLFNCAVCTRLTRNPDHSGTYLCSGCYELAGMDNEVNDTGALLCEGIILERDGWLKDIVDNGGDGERVKRANTYLWPR